MNHKGRQLESNIIIFVGNEVMFEDEERTKFQEIQIEC